MQSDRPDGGFFGDGEGGPDEPPGGATAGGPPADPGDAGQSPPPPPPATPPPPPATPPPPGPPTPGASTAGGGGPRPGGWGRRIIPLHPLTAGDILDGAFKLYRGTFTQVAIAVGVVFGLLQFVVALAIRDVADPLSFDPATTPSSVTDVIPVAAIVALAASTLVTLLATPLVNGAVTWLAARHDLGEDRSWEEGYRAAWSRFGSLLGAAVLTILLGIALLFGIGIVVGLPALLIGQASTAAGVILGVLGALVLLIPAFLILSAVFYVVVPAIMIEGLTATAALRRSYRLLRPQLLRAVGLVVLAGLVLLIVQAVVGIGFGVLSLVAGPIGWLVDAIGATLVQIVTVPIAANIALLIYVDARVRREGFDIEMMAAGLPGD